MCVAPDYVLIPRVAASAFNDALKKALASFFPVDPLSPDSSWSKIVNDIQFNRIQDVLSRTKGTIIVGGDTDDKRRIAPTIVGDVKLDDALMEKSVHPRSRFLESTDTCCSEIFGPVLPIIEVENVDDAVDIISERYVGPSGGCVRCI